MTSRRAKLAAQLPQPAAAKIWTAETSSCDQNGVQWSQADRLIDNDGVACPSETDAKHGEVPPPGELAFMDDDESKTAENPLVFVAHYDIPGTGMERNGNQVDVNDLRTTFGRNRKCNFKEDLNLPKKDLLTILSNDGEFRRKFELPDDAVSDLLFVFILSHGEGEKKICTNSVGECVTTDEVLESMKKLKSFQNANKFVFFVACRGKNIDKATSPHFPADRMKEDNKYSVNILAKPNEKNFAVVHSCVESTYSFRNRNDGTWLVNALCHCINNANENVDAEVLLTILQNRVHKMTLQSTNEGQTVEYKIFPMRRMTFKRSNSVCGENAILKENVTYQWKAEPIVRYKRTAVVHSQCKERRNHSKRLLEDLGFQTETFDAFDKCDQTSAKKESGEDLAVIGCYMFISYSKIVLNDSHQICAYVGGKKFALADILGAHIGSENAELFGKPKVFFFIDETEEIDSPPKTMDGGWTMETPEIEILDDKLKDTFYSGFYTVVLTGKGAVQQFENILKRLATGDVSLQEVVKLEAASSEISPQITSMLPYLLQFPPISGSAENRFSIRLKNRRSIL